ILSDAEIIENVSAQNGFGNHYNYVDNNVSKGHTYYYWIRGTANRSGEYISDMQKVEVPFLNKIEGNYPNPFNPITTIKFSISNSSNVEISVYNILGQKVRQLVNNQLTEGQHTVVWNGTDYQNNIVGSGVYFYKLIQDGKQIDTNKCLLIK
ncbi:MAG: T9SS type A sorting domain-containing protein, partial [Candidatus Cloacimonadota bacterium]|nr:T9SS type A sorting domain-containing protein [Candidatus Cloacimonadota bacterium]